MVGIDGSDGSICTPPTWYLASLTLKSFGKRFWRYGLASGNFNESIFLKSSSRVLPKSKLHDEELVVNKSTFSANIEDIT